MAESILRGGAWWRRLEDGNWVRWDERTNTWEPQTGEPPPPTAAESRSGRPYSSPKGLATATVALLAIGILIDVAAVVSDVAEYTLLQRAEDFGITREEADSNDSRQALIGLLQSLTFLVTGVVFIIWFHHCYKNLVPLGAWDLRFGTGWAIGGWFVPILGWWRPKQIANDIWRAGDPSKPVPLTLRSSERVPPLMTLWWVAWLAGSWLGQVLWRIYRDETPTLSELQNASQVMLVSDALSTFAGVLAIAVVNLLTNRQEQRAGVLAARGDAP